MAGGIWRGDRATGYGRAKTPMETIVTLLIPLSPSFRFLQNA
jgi:hypothetical protein